jgi:hypothetical protein
MELTKEMQEFLCAVDEGYKIPGVVPCGGVSIRRIADDDVKKYKACAVIAAYAHKIKESMTKTDSTVMDYILDMSVDLKVCADEVVKVFNIPMAFLYGFAHGFDSYGFCPLSNKDLNPYSLGLKCGDEKRKQYIIKAT